ncbi:MAG: hybrid sensor histidine kinase/response regulator [Myxococcaceae bacterium]|nr:hybrid sensor histidine kinase/response regulator [Myxococcaceae bacterium]
MGGSDRKKRRRSGEPGFAEVVHLRTRPPPKEAPPPPTPEKVELVLAEMAARVSAAAAIPEAEKAQLALLAELLRPRAAFISHHVPHRAQLQVMTVRGRNDPRIAAARPGEGPVGRAFSEGSVVREGGLICAPLIARRTTVGCLTVVDPKVTVSDELMRAIAAHVAAAWEVCRLHDETVRRTRDLETAVAGLKTIEKSRDEMLSHVSHDLKNPLATMKAYLSLLERQKMGPLTEKQAHAVQACQRNVDRLSRLVHDLVLLSRLRAGDMKLDEKPFGLKAIAEEVVQATAPMALQGGITVDLSRAREVFVRGDRERITEALANIVEQAIDVTPNGGRVRIDVEADEAGVAHVVVEDQGPPLTSDEQAHLFDSYARGASTRSRRPGLGLPIAARIIRLHGGRVAANAKPAEPQRTEPRGALRIATHEPAVPVGNRIDVWLPMYAGAVTPTELAQAPKPGGILLIEDDTDCREVLTEALEQEGYRVIAAASGAEGRSVLETIRPALVFLDIHLQDEDGRAVLRFIRETPALSDVPVWVISGASDLGGLTSGRGPDRIEGFLEKPIQLPRLLDTVASVVRPRRPPAA